MHAGALSVEATAHEIDREISALPASTTPAVRAVRRRFSERTRSWTGEEVLSLALTLLDRHRGVAYELLHHHPSHLAQLDEHSVERLGSGMADWTATDTFGRYVSGPAWRQGVIGDGVIHRWAASTDRWWRRAALVSTVPLNLRAAGGTGDTERTLEVCARSVDDRDDMVVKALSWALRELVLWDGDAVRGFLVDHEDRLSARVRREVTRKLETGLEQPRRRSGGKA